MNKTAKLLLLCLGICPKNVRHPARGLDGLRSRSNRPDDISVRFTIRRDTKASRPLPERISKTLGFYTFFDASNPIPNSRKFTVLTIIDGILFYEAVYAGS